MKERKQIVTLMRRTRAYLFEDGLWEIAIGLFLFMFAGSSYGSYLIPSKFLPLFSIGGLVVPISAMWLSRRVIDLDGDRKRSDVCGIGAR